MKFVSKVTKKKLNEKTLEISKNFILENSKPKSCVFLLNFLDHNFHWNLASIVANLIVCFVWDMRLDCLVSKFKSLQSLGFLNKKK